MFRITALHHINKHFALHQLKNTYHGLQGTVLGIKVKNRRQKQQVFSCNCWDGMKIYKFQNCTSLSAVMEELGDLVLVRNIFSLFSVFLTSSMQTPLSGAYAHCMKMKQNTI